MTLEEPAARREHKVLLVEDEPDALRGMEKILLKEGYQVATADDGLAAIRKLKDESFDVVVADWKMPGADGFEVLREAKEVDENIACIIVTAYATVDNALDAGKLGTFEYIPKPYTPSTLSASVGRAIQYRAKTVPRLPVREKLYAPPAGFAYIQETERPPGFKSPKEIVQAVEKIGCSKAALPWPRLLTLGFLAGAFIAFGGLLAIVVGGGIPGIKAINPGLQKLIFGGVFPVGLMLVVIAGSELFTGNTACCIPAVLAGKVRLAGCARNWVLAYIGNLFGSLFVAFFLAYLTGLLAKQPWLATTVGIAEAKVSQSFLQLFFKGVGCNWLVCLAVWLAVASEDIGGKIWGVWFPIMAFVALGFEHSIANMFFIPVGMFYGAEVTWGQFLVVNLIPVTLGNIVGGAFFVGAIYWYLYGRKE